MNVSHLIFFKLCFRLKIITTKICSRLKIITTFTYIIVDIFTRNGPSPYDFIVVSVVDHEYAVRFDELQKILQGNLVIQQA